MGNGGLQLGSQPVNFADIGTAVAAAGCLHSNGRRRRQLAGVRALRLQSRGPRLADNVAGVHAGLFLDVKL